MRKMMLVVLGLAACCPSEDTSRGSRREAAPQEAVAQASQQAEQVAPQPFEEPQPIYPGSCFSAGQRIWQGKAVDFRQDLGTTAVEFTDLDTGKRIQIEGSFMCVWEMPKGEN